MTFPRTFEDRLLARHWEVCLRRGTLWLEVGLGAGPGGWPSTKPRRLDGLWIADADTRGPKIWSLGDDQLPFEVDTDAVMVIEAKRELNHDVIGQVLAGVDMFGRSYPSRAIVRRSVVIGTKPDPALDEICARWDIAVHAYPEVV
jgi:hypothetical protein